MSPERITPTSDEAVSARARRWLILGGVAVAILGATAVWFLLRPSPADGDAVRGVTEIAVVDDAFDPPVVEVPVGTTVTWTFAGEDAHDIVGDGWGEQTPADTGSFVHTFETSGSYRYTCTLHGGMDGRVDVVAQTNGGAADVLAGEASR